MAENHHQPHLNFDPSTPGTPLTNNGSSKELVQNHAEEAPVPRKKSNRKILLLAALAAVIVIFLAVFLPIYFTIIRKKDGSVRSGGSSSEDITGGEDPSGSEEAPTPTPTKGPTTGGDGSTVTMADGTTFTYKNAFGGFWVHDPEDPYKLDAQPNSWTPPLNQSWDWARNRINGVNIGGLFVLEPFISPAIFQKYPGTHDEWELSEAIMAANGNLDELEEHYRTFYTEQDIAEIAGAGLNWIRLPIGYWIFETTPDEPFLQRTSWNYFLQIVEWARKYGIRVLVDLHAVPGSQNDLNHSGRIGQGVHWLAGEQGIFNAERTLYYLRVLTEFLSQPQYNEVIKVIGLVNEPRAATLGHDPLASFNLRAYNLLREVTGFGEGNGPYIAFQEGMRSLSLWADDLPNADRVIVDGHSYFVFNGANTAAIDVPADDGLPGGTWPSQACRVWGPEYNTSRNDFGPTVGGEFSAAPNDCALFINGVGQGSNHPQCALYQDWENYSTEIKEGIKNYVLASFDSFGDWFFWTWKIGPSAAGRVEAPLWSYKLGLENGWMPTDPRESIGKCVRLGVSRVEWDGTYDPARTGALPSPTIPASYTAQYPWPPPSISDVAGSPSDLPRFPTPTPSLTLPAFVPPSTSTST